MVGCCPCVTSPDAYFVQSHMQLHTHAVFHTDLHTHVHANVCTYIHVCTLSSHLGPPRIQDVDGFARTVGSCMGGSVEDEASARALACLFKSLMAMGFEVRLAAELELSKMTLDDKSVGRRGSLKRLSSAGDSIRSVPSRPVASLTQCLFCSKQIGG